MAAARRADGYSLPGFRRILAWILTTADRPNRHSNYRRHRPRDRVDSALAIRVLFAAAASPRTTVSGTPKPHVKQSPRHPRDRVRSCLSVACGHGRTRVRAVSRRAGAHGPDHLRSRAWVRRSRASSTATSTATVRSTSSPATGRDLRPPQSGAGMFLAEAPIPTSANLADVAVGDFDADGRLDVAAVGTLGTDHATGNVIQGWVVVFLNRTSTGSAGPVTFAPPAGDPVRAASAVGIGRSRPSGRRPERGRDPGPRRRRQQLEQRMGASSGREASASATGRSATDSLSAARHLLRGRRGRRLRPGRCTGPRADPIRRLHLLDVRHLLGGVLDPAGTPDRYVRDRGLDHDPGSLRVRHDPRSDIDGDGFLDLAIASYLTVEVAYGTGGFGFTPVTYPAGPYPVQLAVGDFSGDGLPDIAVARNCPSSGGVGNLSLLVGQPRRAFTEYNDITFGSGIPQCVTAGDFDGDGRLDIAVGRTAGGVDVSFATCPIAHPSPCRSRIRMAARSSDPAAALRSSGRSPVPCPSWTRRVPQRRDDVGTCRLIARRHEPGPGL